MSGYNGYSMSNNAIEAYNQGLCPASKIEKYPSPLIKKFCPFVEWHHCSKNYNKVYFYDPKTVDEVFENNPLAKKALEEYYKKETKIYKNCVVEWIEWSGSFKNPKKKFRKEENCLVETTYSWAKITLSNGLKFRKKLTTKGFSFMENNWISVEEKLPEKDEVRDFGYFWGSIDVLIFDGKNINIGYWVQWEEDEFPLEWKIKGRDSYSISGITHWRYLPETP